MAGVTGTNGKTTTTFLIKHICEKAGLRCGLIGTVRYEIGERVLPAIRTTPESLELQELLAQIVECRMQSRGDGGFFARARAGADARTRVGRRRVHQSHPGPSRFSRHDGKLLRGEGETLHRSARSRTTKKKPVAVINIDDRYGQQLIDRIGKKTFRSSPTEWACTADFRASNYRMEFGGTSYQLDARGKSYLVRVPLIGRFNVANSMAALAAANSLGLNLREAILSLSKSPQVPGRLEAVPAKRQFQVFVDYAHTDDALLNVLKTLRELQPRKLIVVFGCGGDRDRQKRPLMGRVADQNADFGIITSDNPRKENPDAIIAEVEKGFRSDALRENSRSHRSDLARHRPGATARYRPDRRQRPRDLPGIR